jgi:hypothetical protein
VFVVGQLIANLLSIEFILAALAGGAFGAALGALPAFIFTGFMVIAGEAANLAGRAIAQAGPGDPSNLGALGITGLVAFGPPFSPAISFAGGAAAAAYAADRNYMQSGFDFHNAKHIPYALGTKPDVLAVGAIFGVIGYWLQTLFGGLALPFDGIAMGVTVSALIHRLAFGYPLIGDTQGYGLLDMSPFENEEMRVMGQAATDGGEDGEAATDGGATSDRLLVEPWLPHQYKWGGVAAVGATVGLLGGFITVETGSVFLMFGISAASLVFLNCGIEQIPVTHHMALVGSAAAAAVAADGSGLIAGGTTLAVIMAGIFGLGAGLFGELFQRVFYSHSDTHWDPPAAAIAFGSLVIGVLAIIGVFPGSSYIPTLGF